jgi:hypothetical protein
MFVSEAGAYLFRDLTRIMVWGPVRNKNSNFLCPFVSCGEKSFKTLAPDFAASWVFSVSEASARSWCQLLFGHISVGKMVGHYVYLCQEKINYKKHKYLQYLREAKGFSH